MLFSEKEENIYCFERDELKCVEWDGWQPKKKNEDFIRDDVDNETPTIVCYRHYMVVLK